VNGLDLPTHHTGHVLHILVLRNLFGGESLNMERRLWVAMDKAGSWHCANNAIRIGGALICVNQSAKAMTYSSSIA
jgi:hypothetical protein